VFVELPLSIFRGFLMGVGNLVPGVSAGAVALVFGIYLRLVASIRAGSSALGAMVRLDFKGARTWLGRVEWGLVLPLLVGVLLAVFSLAPGVARLLHDYPEVMAALFLGLVAGSVVVAWRLLLVRDATRIAIIIGTGVTVFILIGFTQSSPVEGAAQLAEPALWAVFGAGAVAVCAMILPGGDGSLMLVTLGMYGPMLAALNDRDLATIGVFILGAVIGLALFSQVLHRALRDHYNTMMAALIGLMIGSTRRLWPWPLGVESTAIDAPGEYLVPAVIAAVSAFLLVVGIEAIARRITERPVFDEAQELAAD
jgi:putative membrane protein